MPRLLAADMESAFKHSFKNISVADLCLFAVYAVVFAELEKPHVAHNGGNKRVGVKCTSVFFRFCADCHDFVAVNKLPVGIDTKKSVGITVESKTQIKTVFGNILLQAFYMS